MSDESQIHYPNYDEVCGTCYHFREVPAEVNAQVHPDAGVCRRLPPAILTVAPGQGAAVFAQIMRNYPCCGEHLYPPKK